MFKTEFIKLKQNGITKTAFQRLGDPDVIPLWFGEGDLATPSLIRDEAKIALDSGRNLLRSYKRESRTKGCYLKLCAIYL